MKQQYHLPANVYNDWNACEFRVFTLTDRQLLVVNAVREAVDVKGLFYSSEVFDFCIERLKPSDADKLKGLGKVERGEVGMDLYYARKYLDAQKRFQNEDEAHALLRPYVGMKLGSLVFQDFKLTTSWVVKAVDGPRVTLIGKRGGNEVGCRRDYVSRMDLSDATRVLAQLPAAFEHFNEEHPHSGLKMTETNRCQTSRRSGS